MLDSPCRYENVSGFRANCSRLFRSLALPLALSGSLLAQAPHHRQTSVVIPTVSHVNPSDLGLREHANVRILMLSGVSPAELPPQTGFGFETPASLACVYDLAPQVNGCNPNSTTTDSSGGSGAIAVVDPFDDPDAASDLATFSTQFGLPRANLSVVHAAGSTPPVDPTGGWELEEALDIEYAHAMAPAAKIYLVEAKSNDTTDLFQAVQVASNLVRCGSVNTCSSRSTGQGQVSMSWGGEETSTQTQLDSFFTTPGVEYLAAAGDEPGVSYPCSSPNVVCVGGTSTARSDVTGNLIAEIGWSDAGGGVSAVEPLPPYQAGVAQVTSQTGSFRGVPDISADSNPSNGAWVFDSYPMDGDSGWFIVGGTSLATPVVAGILNVTGSFADSTSDLLTAAYGSPSGFRDIVYGACGPYTGSFSATGWDLCTGLGSPISLTTLTSSGGSSGSRGRGRGGQR